MSTLSKNGNRVLFIENTGVRSPGIRDIPRLKKRFKDYFKGVKGIRKEMDNLYIYSPIVLPFPYSRIARQINKYLLISVLDRWIKTVDFADPIIWTFLPTGMALDIINDVNKKFLIYYCIDNFAVSSASARKVKQTEEKLLKTADLVFVTSRALYDRCLKHTGKVSIFPFGVNIDNFETVRVSDTGIPAELKDIKKPIIGYVGGVHKWIDQELIKSLAQDRPDYSFIFVGPLQTDVSSLSNVKNIYLLGNKKHEELPNLIKNFSVAIIPYHITEYTRNVYPTKLNEYLAMGKPVVSTGLAEVEMFNKRYANIVYTGKNVKEFGEAIERAIKEDSEDLQIRRIKTAHDNSWQSRIEQMSDLIEPAMTNKLLDKETRWRENLIAFYRAARKRLARAVAVAALSYLLLFHTPFIWFLAEPLKIADTPRKADAIVVFAGGVGESGKAGQGYEERLKYAVELYKKGYANRLIFSSGYTYAIKEIDIMKALAISMGVAPDAVLLENQAGNTYENVKYTKMILDKEGWTSILLISSPYHMRRVSLVYNKAGGGLKVAYTPIPESRFYRHATTASLEQTRAIIHEYLGILYYWWRGYIFLTAA